MSRALFTRWTYHHTRGCRIGICKLDAGDAVFFPVVKNDVGYVSKLRALFTDILLDFEDCGRIVLQS